MISCRIKEMKGKDYYILVPYEINHDFFMQLQSKIFRGVIDLPRIRVTAPDFGGRKVFSGDQLDTLIQDYEVIETNIDLILSKVTLPKSVGMFDGYVFVGYVSNLEYENYVELGKGGFISFEKRDLLYLISLLKKMANEAKEMGGILHYSGD